jgi:hypothetical protein
MGSRMATAVRMLSLVMGSRTGLGSLKQLMRLPAPTIFFPVLIVELRLGGRFLRETTIIYIIYIYLKIKIDNKVLKN